MNIFYEEGGQFKVASIVTKNDASYQVDTQHGKRAKIKANNVFLEFDGALEPFLTQALATATDVDVDFLWEVCGEEEFSAQQIAEEYFGHKPSNTELAATYIKIYAAPMYFYKKAKGFFKAAPEDTLKAALAAIERKKQEEAQIDAWADALCQNELPDAIRADLMTILHLPNKQSLTYKAFALAADRNKQSPLALAQAVGGLPSIPEYLRQGFLLQHFSKGTGFPELPIPALPTLPEATGIKAFSIDDISTTEIDDAISVTPQANGSTRLGIHIAVPSLAINADSDIERLIFNRLSTVYYPGDKITMLPDDWVKHFTLDAGRSCPALSLYIDVMADNTLSTPECKVENVWIDANIRLHEIEPLFNQDTLAHPATLPDFAYKNELLWLHQLAVHLETARGRHDPSRPVQFDYGIDVDEHEHVRISKRQRGAPIDLLVSEMMILANSHWAKMLDDNDTPGIFRVQPTGKVRMSTQSEPHVGMGVSHYAWCTSPLRRAVDYINQSQILGLIDHKPMRYQSGDSMLFAVLRDFEATYSAYNDFQRKMEHYWCLRYLQQEQITELTALVLKEDLVRIQGLPMVQRIIGLPQGTVPKSIVKLGVHHIDVLNQTAQMQFLSLESAPEPMTPPTPAAAADAPGQTPS
ncbi:MAG: RNB domain-containing ribonuclease [Neisseriaceae bacterium]|nr:RNB domain-containing ribonuclease [Neisseriaceae bacterium]